MRSKQKIVGIALLLAVVIVASVWGLSHYNFAVLNTVGEVGDKQRNLMIVASLLSLIVVIPVFVLLGTFAWKYRDTNRKPGKYQPELDGNHKLEAIWWGVPAFLLVILSVLIWNSSHDLDPYKPLDSTVRPVKVQVVSLDWKWLFIYPDKGVAAVNTLPLPVGTPVNFEITSDAPMNSFWIPQLGGQVYAMSGMSTKLHLQADKIGDYSGSSANISGEGFAGMTFKANVMSDDDFQKWVLDTRASQQILDTSSYTELSKPSQNVKPAVYALGAPELYDTIIMKYMGHGNTNSAEAGGTMTHDMAGME
ncbi:ubiquinol oxidase subunit II [Candidatus Saccharibacteria bacterium]|nr:MAG: ubiquinol oxidase subunit II [Candidatus Saccharibacteria bacterium]